MRTMHNHNSFNKRIKRLKYFEFCNNWKIIKIKVWAIRYKKIKNRKNFVKIC